MINVISTSLLNKLIMRGWWPVDVGPKSQRSRRRLLPTVPGLHHINKAAGSSRPSYNTILRLPRVLRL